MRVIAKVISIIFHPLFVLTYMLWILLVTNPYMFGYSKSSEADVLVLMVFLTSAFIPLVAVGLMKGLGWIESLQMADKQERIGPYIVTGILYLSLYMHLVKSNAFPRAFHVATLGAIIALFVAFFVNNFQKISIHALAMGGIVSMTVLCKRYYSGEVFSVTVPGLGSLQLSTMIMLYAVILIAGLVCTSRLILKRHSVREVYAGFIVGFFAQLVAYLALQ